MNLRCALLNLRLLDKPRTLWIDAICIDQANIPERNQQVSIMAQIYSRASQTIVWLCDQTNDTAEAFSMLEDLAEEALSVAPQHNTSSANGAKYPDVAHFNNQPISMIEKPDVSTPMFDRYKNDSSILHIVCSSWWYRAWTIQEILLASRATIGAGQHTMDWDRFCIDGNQGLNLGLWLPTTMGIIQDPITMPYLSLQSLRRKLRDQNMMKRDAQAFLDFLISCRFREATDPRDKIYSLLGFFTNNSLSRHAPLGITPDYGSPIGAVYTHATRQMLLGSATLDVLGAGPPPTVASKLPTWVPDWSITDFAAVPLILDALNQPRITHATNQSVSSPLFLDNGESLLLHAHEVTTLVALAQPLSRIQYRSRDELLKHGFDSQLRYVKANGSMLARLAVLGDAWKILAGVYEVLMSAVPHLGTYASWEAFAREVPPTNPVPDRSKAKKTFRSEEETSSRHTISSLISTASAISMAPGLATNAEKEEEEPDDPLAAYWQTLCTGTYATDADAKPGKSPKIATQQMFYSWRASLKPISDLRRWHVDRMLRPLGFVGYVRKTWHGFGEFARYVEGAYERRLGRGANGHLCLVPTTTEVGDKVVLAKGGRVPLVVRQDGRAGYWKVIGEAYVHGIMDGQAWDESKCTKFKIR